MNTLFEREFTSASPQETVRFGRAVSSELSRGDVVFLEGCIGAGKTTLVKGIARGLGVKSTIKSPSFIIAGEYRGKKGRLFHIDLYRLNSREINFFGFEDYFDGGGICVVEWADKFPKKNGFSGLRIKIEDAGKNRRKIICKRLVTEK